MSELPASNEEGIKPRDPMMFPEISRQVLEDIGGLIKSGKDNALRVLLLVTLAAAGAACEKKAAPQDGGREGRVFTTAEEIASSKPALKVESTVESPNPVTPPPKENTPELVSPPTPAPQKVPIINQHPTLAAPTEPEKEKFKPYSIRIDDSVLSARYYVDEDGNNIFGEERFEEAEPFCEGFAVVKRFRTDEEDQYIYINKNGVNAFGDKKFEKAERFRGGIALVKLPGEEGKYYYINKKGENAFGKEFSVAKPFSEGLAAVCLGECYYINRGGENAFGDRKFYDTESFSGGFAVIRESGSDEYSYIDRNGESAFGGKKFSSAGPFHGDFAKVVEGARPYTMDKKGKQVKRKQVE